MLETVKAGRWQPLTPAQFDFWEEFTFHPHRPVSTVAHCLTVRGEVNEKALLAALEQVIAETDIFSVQFRLPAPNAAPQQCCEPRRRPRVRIIDLQRRPHAPCVAAAMMQGDIDGQLNLLRQPLAAVWLIRFAPGHYAIYIRAHHIIVDGFGMTLIEHRCAELYRAWSARIAASPPFGAFYDFLAEERQYVDSERWRQERAYWLRLLADAPALPVLQKGGENYAAACLHSDAPLPACFSRQLLAFAECCDACWPDLLLALSAAWLAACFPGASPQETLPVWVPVMNRRGSAAASVPALAVNILPLFVQVEEQERVDDYVRRMAAALREMRAHGRYRIETLAAERGIGKGMRYFFSPLINVLPFDPPLFAGCESEREVLASGPGDGFNITWRGRTDASELHLAIDADASLYPSLQAAAIREQLVVYLQNAIAPESWRQPVSSLLSA